MSTDTLTAMANAQTPTNVEVPKGLAGFVFWIVGQFGPTLAIFILVTIYFGYDRERVYRDLQQSNASVMTAFTARTTIEVEHVQLLRSMQSTLTRVDSALDRLAKATPPNP